MKTNSFLQPILRAVLANVLGLALSAPMAFAGSSSAHIYSHAVDQDTRIAVSLEKPADAVMVNIKLVSTARSEEDRRKEVKAMTASLAELADKQPKMEFFQGAIQERYYGKSKVSSSVSGQVTGQANVTYLLGEGEGKLVAETQIRALLKSIPQPRGGSISSSKSTLVMKNLERFHPELMQKIAEHAAVIRIAFPKGKLSLTGLESRIHVSEVDDRHVKLYMPYTLGMNE